MHGFSTISHCLRGEYSMFGLRAEFYIEYREAWVIVAIILIMNLTAACRHEFEVRVVFDGRDC